MNIIITEEAKGAIQDKGGNIMVKQISCDSCAGAIQRLWSEASSRQEDKENYDKYEYEGINIFLEKTLTLGDTIGIEQRSTLPVFGPTFTISGIKITF